MMATTYYSPSVDEETALLPAADRPLSRQSSHTIIHPTHSPHVITSILCIIFIVLSSAGSLIQIPSWRLYEDIICHHYYNERAGGEGHIGFQGKIDEGLCKGEGVQAELNNIVAGLLFANAVPSLITIVLYGLLADRIGRKPVFLLAFFGLIMQAFYEMTVVRFWMVIPLRLIWLSPVWTMIGGGEAVGVMMFYTIVSDVTKDEDRANVFFKGVCAVLCGQLLAPTLASTLMKKSPWIPYLLGTGVLILGTTLITLIPETLHMHLGHSPPPETILSDSDTLLPDSDSDIETSPKTQKNPITTSLKTLFHHGFKQFQSNLTLLSSPPILLLLITFLIQPFSRQSIDLSIRYISNRFSWPLAQAGYLLSLRALINIALLLLVLPSITHYLLTRLNLTARSTNFLLARLSIIILILGSLTIALSPTVGLTIIGLTIYTMGTGYLSLARALITGLVDKEHVGRLYAAISIVETTGTMVAGPALGALYTEGLRIGGAWVGLPFLALLGICLLGGVGIWGFGLTVGRERLKDEESRRGGRVSFE